MNLTTLEQSKKLKECGAPQETSYYWAVNGEGGWSCGTWVARNPEFPKGSGVEPISAYSLEEMMDWLGNEFFYLVRQKNGFLTLKRVPGENQTITVVGDTRLEAVFNLAELIHTKK